MRAAVPPFTADGLRQVLEKVQRWAPYVDGILLDDVAAVLDDYTPSEKETADFALRLRGHLQRLAALALSDGLSMQDEQLCDLVAQAHALRSAVLPADRRQAVGHLRRMAWTLEALLERMVARQRLKEEP
ncbi:DUF6415 family natural product biosynthesis protein [Streptomyces fructofermentans]|uniref:DUF6415 family natural product biosynthesis protein n=1 Tax=Streptomyces fructofermentans TaxID=152141 RepID=UPI0016794B43|nr:DUF6415 family natural product biosynthesis protein [Streptomyces fructofermentans]